MNYDEGRCVGSRLPTLPPISNRTLHHPSFLPLYMAADFAPHHPECNTQTVHPITPAEFFYCDPTMSSGRIPNTVSNMMVFDCFQLNTPPPVMSACVAPPTCSDPFRSALHPTRDLGSLAFKTNTLHPPVQPNGVILQLTQEEDQAITTLLKLHHQEPIQSDESLSDGHMNLNPTPFLDHPEPMDSTSAEEVCKPLCGAVQHPREAGSRGQLQQGRFWSHEEIEAANTLLSCFSPMENDQTHNKSAATLPEPQPNHHKGPETFPAPLTTDCTQNDDDHIRRTPGEPGSAGLEFLETLCADYLSVCDEYLAFSLSSVSKEKSRSRVSLDLEVKERALADSEEDAVFVLLNLGDMGVLDAVQGSS